MSMFLELNDAQSEKIYYDYPDYPVYIRREQLSDYPNYRAQSHFHNDIELIAILSGEMDYNVNGRIIPLREGEGILVNANQIHFGFSGSHSECDFICCLLHPMLLCASHAYERDYVLPLINKADTPFVKLRREVSWQREIWLQIRIIYEVRKEKSAPLKVQTAFWQIWSLFYENTSLTEHQGKTRDSNLIILKNMVGFIQQSYAEKISLADIAASGAVGQSKCCQMFSKYLGQTPNMYLNQYRLNKSTELLRGTDMSVTQIAVSTGFGSASYYAEAFRRWLGKSPTTYRNESSTSVPPFNGSRRD